jgi:hypothetical protein
LTVAVLLSGLAMAAKPATLVLVTPDEARAKPAARTRGSDPLPDDGPKVDLVSPGGSKAVRAPFRLEVKFAPRGAEVDLASLRVEIVKFIDIDVTDRVKPYAAVGGILADNVDVPSGKHLVRLTLLDKSGKRTVHEWAVEVN